jgi:hypothetical protein
LASPCSPTFDRKKCRHSPQFFQLSQQRLGAALEQSGRFAGSTTTLFRGANKLAEWVFENYALTEQL